MIIKLHNNELFSPKSFYSKGFRVDASKHMWPKDLEAIQGKLNDVLDGGRPFIYHEVIDLCEQILD